MSGVATALHGRDIKQASRDMSARAQAILPDDEAPLVQPYAGAFERRALKRILVVDDEAHVLRVLRLSLDRNGYEVDTALDGEIALTMLREQRYAALIVSAEFAPRGGGLCDVVQRQFSDDAPLMLVMVDNAEEAEWRGDSSAVERVERPVSLRWIVARLNEYFGDYQAR